MWNALRFLLVEGKMNENELSVSDLALLQSVADVQGLRVVIQEDCIKLVDDSVPSFGGISYAASPQGLEEAIQQQTFFGLAE
jgi:hypothetical protein